MTPTSDPFDARPPFRASNTRRGFLVLSGSVVATSLIAPRAAGASAPDPAVPTYEQVNGYALGSRQASLAELDGYVTAVAAASSRVKVSTIAHSVEGRAIRSVVVSSARNLRRLPAIARAARRLRDHPTTRADARKAADGLPAFVMLLPNVHGNEPSGADALMQVLYDLASGQDAVTQRRLDNMVVVMATTQNPDGRENGTRPNAMGFDLNRDWFAMTQPETPAKIELYGQYPAVVGLDLHEQFFQGPDAYFFPPNADPIHREASRAGLTAANKVLSPAVAKRFDAEGWSYSHYGIYDLFAPIYGDSVPNQAFGAAGFLMEMANEAPYATRFDRVYAATDAALAAVVTHRKKLVTAWADQWVKTRNEGSRGELRRNVVQDPEGADPLPAPTTPVYGYAIRGDVRAADVSHLVKRLLSYQVQVYVTRHRIRAGQLRAFGAKTFEEETLPAGTIVVPAAQPMGRWVHTLLEDDPHAAVNYFYDVSGWSNPQLMRLSGGALGAPIASWLRSHNGRPSALRRVERLTDLRPPVDRRPTAKGYAFAVDSAMAQVAAFRLLRKGIDVGRLMDGTGELAAGTAVVPAGAYAELRAVTARLGVPVEPVRSLPREAVALRRPRVAVITDLVSGALEFFFARSSGYAQWLLQERFGLDVDVLLANEIDAGTLVLAEAAGNAYDAVVVPDGFATVLPSDYPNLDLGLPGAGMTPLGLAQLNLFVRGGGTYVGWSQQGIATAQAAGLAGDLTMTVPVAGLDVPGSPFAVDVHGDDPATVGLRGRGTVYNFRDPILEGGGTTLVRYPEEVRSFGYAEGIEVLAGTVAATGLHVGSGRSYVCSFDPAFRGWSEAAQALVGNMLLAPPPGDGGADAGPVLGDFLPLRNREVMPGREIVVRVAGADGQALRDAVAAVSAVPPDRQLVRGPSGSLELRVSDARPLSGHPPAWVRSVLERLAAGGARPTFLVS